MSKCLICDATIDAFISFGEMPIANGFLSPDEFGSEYFFELKVGFCHKCKMVQLLKQPEREKMFHKDYAFFSSTSSSMTQHFKAFAELIVQKYLSPEDPLVIELGSNDGIMLQNFAKAGIRHIGIEPSENVGKTAADKGINTICRFFDAELATEILKADGQADAIMAANVMCHIPYLHSVFSGIKLLLKPKGVFIFEDPYLGDIIEKISYDQIYDEHAFYFSVTSLEYLLTQYGLELVNVIPQNVHGGSMRYVIAHTGNMAIDASVDQQREKENSIGLSSPDTYATFRVNVEKSREQLITLLRDLRKEGKRIVGYAATSKSTTITNYCGITPDLVEYISDTTPIKQGKFSPGTHIPVRPYQAFCDDYPDYALLFAWNHANEIMAKEQNFLESGGNWIVYVPRVEVKKNVVQ